MHRLIRIILLGIATVLFFVVIVRDGLRHDGHAVRGDLFLGMMILFMIIQVVRRKRESVRS